MMGVLLLWTLEPFCAETCVLSLQTCWRFSMVGGNCGKLRSKLWVSRKNVKQPVACWRIEGIISLKLFTLDNQKNRKRQAANWQEVFPKSLCSVRSAWLPPRKHLQILSCLTCRPIPISGSRSREPRIDLIPRSELRANDQRTRTSCTFRALFHEPSLRVCAGDWGSLSTARGRTSLGKVRWFSTSGSEPGEGARSEYQPKECKLAECRGTSKLEAGRTRWFEAGKWFS